jgi:hypothetical protein
MLSPTSCSHRPLLIGQLEHSSLPRGISCIALPFGYSLSNSAHSEILPGGSKCVTTCAEGRQKERKEREAEDCSLSSAVVPSEAFLMATPAQDRKAFFTCSEVALTTWPLPHIYTFISTYFLTHLTNALTPNYSQVFPPHPTQNLTHLHLPLLPHTFCMLGSGWLSPGSSPCLLFVVLPQLPGHILGKSVNLTIL